MRPERILIVKLSAIGDIVHCLPAVTQLRNTFKEAQIDWLVEEKNRTVIDISRLSVGVIPINIKQWRNHFGWNALIQIVTSIKKIRAAQYDCVIDFQGLIKSGVLTYLSGAPCRIGFSRAALKEPLASLCYTKTVTPNSVHIVDQLQELLSPLGLSARLRGGPLFASKKAHEAIKHQLHDIGDVVVINPGGGWITKRWPKERFIELARQLANKGLPVVVTYPPGEKEWATHISLHSESGIYTIGTTLEELVALCARARLFVGGDTGPMHIASAMGVPVVALFGPTDSGRNGPVGKEDQVVERSLSCRPCHKRDRCPLDHWNCMEEISVERVLDACLKRLERPVKKGEIP
jgi:lipopolysaccharide heptosyltransferase I